MQKVFRVFVSSTFSDFKDEREILQTEISLKSKNTVQIVELYFSQLILDGE